MIKRYTFNLTLSLQIIVYLLQSLGRNRIRVSKILEPDPIQVQIILIRIRNAIYDFINWNFKLISDDVFKGQSSSVPR